MGAATVSAKKPKLKAQLDDASRSLALVQTAINAAHYNRADEAATLASRSSSVKIPQIIASDGLTGDEGWSHLHKRQARRNV
jgi:hypothetical protein